MVKPGTKAAANLSIRALMTNQKRPRTHQRNWERQDLEEQTRVAFTRPMANAAINAVPKPAMSNPRMT